MEENKLDKFTNKIFGIVGIFSAFITNLQQKTSKKVFLLFGLFQLVIGISLAVVIISLDTTFTIYNFITILTNIVVGVCFIHIWLKSLSDIDLKILKFTKKFYSEETIKLCFEPLIADWKTEYSQAIKTNHKWKAQKITFSYIYAFLCAIIQQTWLGKIFELIKRF